MLAEVGVLVPLPLLPLLMPVPVLVPLPLPVEAERQVLWKSAVFAQQKAPIATASERTQLVARPFLAQSLKKTVAAEVKGV